MYFRQFPLIAYDPAGKNKSVIIAPDLLNRVVMRTKSKENSFMFTKYDIMEGETPESLAFDLYENAQLHWVILITNGITDRYHQWPLSYQQFESFLYKKYTNVDAVHHYEINFTSGDTTKVVNVGTSNADYPSATIITNYEYEVNRQDELRKISLLGVEFLPQFLKEFSQLI